MLKCKHGCGYEHEHKGAMNLHEGLHCPKIRKRKDKKDDPGCIHKYRLLNQNDKAEAAAINDGYVEVCEKCQVLKT